MAGLHPARPDDERARDERLVAALRAGEEEVFAQVVDAWSGSMLRLARAYVPTDSAAEDVVQETWLAVLEGLAGFEGRSGFRTWVYRILVNQAKRRGVRERRTIPVASLRTAASRPAVDPDRFRGPEDEYPGHWREFPEEWPEQVALSHEVRGVVLTALAGLPPRQRVVVALRDVEGRTAEEVSALLHITAGNQRVLLHRGRTVVRAHLERYLTGAPAGAGGAGR